MSRCNTMTPFKYRPTLKLDDTHANASNSVRYSVLCDKLELGVPAGLRFLKQGDFVDLSLECVHRLCLILKHAVPSEPTSKCVCCYVQIHNPSTRRRRV